MQALILAAGMGSRLKQLTASQTKCMIKVNGVTLIERMLRQLDAHHVERIVIVIGYEGEKLRHYISTLHIHAPIVYVHNPIYDKTNNIYSLSLAKDYLLEDDTILCESDLILDDDIFDELLNDRRDTLALVDKYAPWMDGTVIKIDSHDRIKEFIPGSQLIYADRNDYYKTVNVYKFSRDFSATHYLPFLDAYTKALGENEYYEQVLRVLTLLDNPGIEAKRLTGQNWYEIDDVQDLDIASSIFHPDPNQRRELLQSRYGGYWRYPELLDFCYLVNPYYPSQRMKDEMKSNFEVLLSDYPSGMRVNSLLAAKNFGVVSHQIVVGNGASELIKSLMTLLPTPFGCVRPTFEEYPHRQQTPPVVFQPSSKDFHYSASELIDFFEEHPVASLVLINPDNPTGNYIPRNEMLQLVQWCEKKKIKCVLDESFIDFADEKNPSLLDSDLLERYPHLIIVKSISKSFGVAGLRLGIAASGDRELIDTMKKDVAIWNINSFAEFYLQIEEKYKKDYAKALHRFREERAWFVSALQKISFLRVLDSQANFVTCELLDGLSSTQLTTDLLDKKILIKDLSSKEGFNGDYIRLAVRDRDDNTRLIQALSSIKVDK